MHGKEPERRQRSVFDRPTYVLICNNSDCRLRIPIGRPQYCEVCPRCGCPMICEQQT